MNTVKKKETWPKNVIWLVNEDKWSVTNFSSYKTNYTHADAIKNFSVDELIRLLRIFDGAEVYYDTSLVDLQTLYVLENVLIRKRFIPLDDQSKLYSALSKLRDICLKHEYFTN